MDRDHDAIDFRDLFITAFVTSAFAVLLVLFLAVALFYATHRDDRPSGCAGLSAAETAACVTEGRL